MTAPKVIKLTFVVGGALVAIVCAYALTRSPLRVLRAGAAPTVVLTAFYSNGEACQPNEVLPAHVTAIRLSLVAYVAAPVHVKAYSGTRLLTQGSRGSDWTGTSVTVPVKPLSHSASDVTLCFDVAPNSQAIYLFGSEVPASEAMTIYTGQRIPAKLDAEYLAVAKGTWWSRILPVARRMGLGRAFSGTWIVLLIAALVAAVAILAGRLTLRESS
jgi:hypothetical protein